MAILNNDQVLNDQILDALDSSPSKIITLQMFARPSKFRLFARKQPSYCIAPLVQLEAHGFLRKDISAGEVIFLENVEIAKFYRSHLGIELSSTSSDFA